MLTRHTLNLSGNGCPPSFNRIWLSMVWRYPHWIVLLILSFNYIVRKNMFRKISQRGYLELDSHPLWLTFSKRTHYTDYVFQKPSTHLWWPPHSIVRKQKLLTDTSLIICYLFYRTCCWKVLWSWTIMIMRSLFLCKNDDHSTATMKHSRVI